MTVVGSFRGETNTIALEEGYVLVSNEAANWGNGMLRGQRYSDEGTEIGGAFTLHRGTTLASYADGVLLSNGSLVLTWSDNHKSIQAKIFSPNGRAVGDVFDVMDEENGLSHQKVVALNDGGFVVVWTERQGVAERVVSQQFDNAGEKIGDEYLIERIGTLSKYSTLIADKFEVMELTDGSYAVSYMDKNFNIASTIFKSGAQGITGVTSTPIILDLDGDGVETLGLTEGVTFDIDGSLDDTGWVAADDALLVRDINNDGLINDARELFGEETIKRDAPRAIDGFDALGDIDSNQDGVFDASDDAYNEVMLWQDKNSDGISQQEELQSLLDADVASINLDAQAVSENNQGNRTGLRSTWSDHEGPEHAVDDVLFAYKSGDKD